MEKVAQCRYCTNSSNEGRGVWFKDRKRWICIPCLVAILQTMQLSEIFQLKETGCVERRMKCG